MRFLFGFRSSLIVLFLSFQTLANSGESCAEKYDRMHADGLLNISLVYGYLESDGDLVDLMADEYWRNRTIEVLVGKCPSRFGLGANNYVGAVEHVKKAKEDREQLAGR